MDPRGIRNNNPGNIRAGDPWRGLTGEDDAGFCIFDTPEHGIRALAKILIAYQVRWGLRTISEMICRWAPPVENDTPSYIQSVCKAVGANPIAPYTLTPGRLRDLVTAIIRHENGEQPYKPEVIQAGVDMAFVG